MLKAVPQPAFRAPHLQSLGWDPIRDTANFNGFAPYVLGPADDGRAMREAQKAERRAVERTTAAPRGRT
jgi:hypothetical protein